jgi:hypothetical protein
MLGNGSNKLKFHSGENKEEAILIMLATIQGRTFCLLVCCLKNKQLECKGKVVPVLNSALRHEDVCWSGSTDQNSLDLVTRWKRMVSFTS